MQVGQVTEHSYVQTWIARGQLALGGFGEIEWVDAGILLPSRGARIRTLKDLLVRAQVALYKLCALGYQLLNRRNKMASRAESRLFRFSLN